MKNTTLTNWDNLTDMEQIYLYWEFQSSDDFFENMTFTDFDNWVRENI